ncbi:MAG: hypothetical protein VW378_01405 [bacterium]
MVKLLILFSLSSLFLSFLQIAFSDHIKHIEGFLNRSLVWGNEYPFSFASLLAVFLLIAATLIFYIALHFHLA